MSFDLCWLRGLICGLGLLIVYVGREYECREVGDGKEEGRKVFLKGKSLIYREGINFL